MCIRDRDIAQRLPTVDEVGSEEIEEAVFEAADYEVSERDKHRLEEIMLMGKFSAYAPVRREDYPNAKFLRTRFVDTEGKSRFVAKEFNTGATDEFFAQASGRLVDVLASHRRHSRLVLDVHRAFLHLVEDEIVLVDPPALWKEQEEAAGRDSSLVWRMQKVLYGRRKAPKEWLKYFGRVLVEHAGLIQSASAPQFFRSSNGQVFLEVHMDDIHASGPTADLEQIVKIVGHHVSVKHADIYEAWKEAVYYHLRRERILTKTGCYIRANVKYVEEAASLLGLEHSKPVPTQ